MRSALLAVVVLCGCAAPDWRPDSLASVHALSLQPSTGSRPTEDVAMGLDGAMLLPSPDGGAPIEVPHRRSTGPSLQPKAAPCLDLDTCLARAPGLGSLLWERGSSPAPYRSGVQLYRSRQLKLLVGTRTMLDERYPDSVTDDPRHDPQEWDTAAVVGLRLGF